MQLTQNPIHMVWWFTHVYCYRATAAAASQFTLHFQFTCHARVFFPGPRNIYNSKLFLRTQNGSQAPAPIFRIWEQHSPKNSYARCELNFHRMCAAMNISDWFLAIFVSSLLNRNIHRFSMAVIIFECVMCAIIIFCSRPFCIFKPFGCMKSSTILEDVHFKYSRHNHNRSHINFAVFYRFDNNG